MNYQPMSVTRNTSHSPIGPCGPVEQLPTGDSLRQASRALLSSSFDCGENTGNGGQEHVLFCAVVLLSRAFGFSVGADIVGVEAM